MADINPPFDDLGIVSRTVYGEARGESREGQAAVAWVIKNRTDHPGWWGHSIREVCLRPKQFSCWNFGDPNRQKILDLESSDPTLVAIRAIVEKVWRGEIADPTGGATSYHTIGVVPEWDSVMTKTAEIGHHIFMRESA